MTNQEALRLADALDLYAAGDEHQRDIEDAAAELRHLHYENERLAAMVDAQQPAPSAAVASKAVLAAIRAANMQLVRTGDDEFMLVTLKQAMPQADSQSAPTNTRQIAECYGDCPTGPKTCANPCKFEGRAARAPADSQPAPEYVGNGMFKGETIDKAAEHWANWCDVRCMTGLSEFLRVVAARAPTDSVCYDYAKQIAESMWATHYKADAPNWKSCDSLMGVLSQISNMMCGLSRAPADSVTAPASGANWQDISTAPKDGTRFVAVGNNYGLYSEAQHTCIAQWFRGCWMDVSEWNETSELKYLTHWMPLLPLPGTAARKKGGRDAG